MTITGTNSEHAPSTRIRIAALAVASAVAGTALGYGNYSIGSLQTGYVPDFDQLREFGPLDSDGEHFYYNPPGLANSGFMYCVPTSAANWLGWIANHGYPEVMPTGAPANWHPTTSTTTSRGSWASSASAWAPTRSRAAATPAPRTG